MRKKAKKDAGDGSRSQFTHGTAGYDDGFGP